MRMSNLLVVIPTRNRADFAINAIRSVASQSDCKVLVSDNSTDPLEQQKLSNYANENYRSQVTYVRPPKSLAMTPHWDWAMQNAMGIKDITHVTYLTDRMMFLQGAVLELLDLLATYRDKPLSFGNDSVKDGTMPVVLCQRGQSGKLYKIESSHLLEQFADVNIVYPALPRLMNSAVPVELIKGLHSRYGNYFASVSPDFNFAFRILREVGSVYYYDRSLMVDYGVYRSNGNNFPYGVLNKEAKDFSDNLETEAVSFPTPVDTIAIVPNCILHEYVEVANSSSDSKFPQIDQSRYLTFLVRSVYQYQNPESRERMLKQLRAHLGRTSILWYRLRSAGRRLSNSARIRWHNLRKPDQPYISFRSFDSVDAALSFANQRRAVNPGYGDITKERFGGYGKGVTTLLEYPPTEPSI